MRKEKEKRSRKRKKINKRHNSWEDLSSSSLEEIFSSEDFSEEEIIKGEKGVEIEKGEKLSNKQLKMLVQAATEEKKASENPLCRDISSLHRSSVSDIFPLKSKKLKRITDQEQANVSCSINQRNQRIVEQEQTRQGDSILWGWSEGGDVSEEAAGSKQKGAA